MLRTLPMLVGFVILLTVGVVHGLWTDRWQPSSELIAAAERIERLPPDLKDWKGEPFEQSSEALEMAGATAHYSRYFVDPETGDKVLVMLLVGKAARMAVHRPEHCYVSAGYLMQGKPIQVKVEPKGLPNGEFATSLFVREEATGPNQLRIFWSYFANDRWSIPSSPRWTFAREKILYKLYVLRNVAAKPEPINQDPCIRLLGELLPVLDRTLSLENRE